MKKERLVEVAKLDGWVEDKWGHLQKSVNTVLGLKEYRLKIQATSCRIEIRTRYAASIYSPARVEWVRIGGDYYKNMVDTLDGRVRIGNIFIGKKVAA
jgi:hypothetical protein